MRMIVAMVMFVMIMAMFYFVICPAVNMGWLQIADCIGQSHAQQQRDGQLQPVVRVKVQLGQQIAQREADEDSGCERQSATEP